MSEIYVDGKPGLVKNAVVYDMKESCVASRYPMTVDKVTYGRPINELTARLGSTPIGCGEDNFLNGIRVAFDLTLSNKAWVEMERYHFMDFVSSQSTMHKILQFDLDEQCNNFVDRRVIDVLKEKIAEYKRLEALPKDTGTDALYRRTDKMKELYLEILYNIPSGFRLTARMTTNYRQLKTIYYQRKNHRLPEWREFCKWVETLPRFKEMVLGEKNEPA